MEQISLKSEEHLVLRPQDDTFLIYQGSCLVFLAPLQDGKQGRQMYLGTALFGDYIPNGWEKDGCIYRILLRPLDDCILSRIRREECSPIYQDYLDGSLLSLAFLSDFLDQPQAIDSFQKKVEEHYQEQGREHLRIIREKTQQVDSGEKSKFYMDFFSGLSFSYKLSALKRTKEPLYDGVSFLASLCGQEVAPLGTIRTYCKDTLTPRDIARVSGFIIREVSLPVDWKRMTADPFLVTRESSNFPLVVFRRLGKLLVLDMETGKTSPVKEREEELSHGLCWVISKSLPYTPLKGKEVMQFLLRQLSASDAALYLVASLLITLVGLGLSNLYQTLYGQITVEGDRGIIYGVGGVFLLCMLINGAYLLVQGFTEYRVMARLTQTLQMAIFDRVFHMPEHFYRKKESAEMAFQINHLSDMYINVFQNGCQAAVQLFFSLFYCYRMLSISSELSLLAFALVLVLIVLTAVNCVFSRRINRKKMRQKGKIRSLLYQCLGGISTIRIAGAQDHALSHYTDMETDMMRTNLKANYFQNYFSVFSGLLGSIGSILMLYWMGKGINLSLGVFMGFITANSLFQGAILNVTNRGMNLITMLPVLKDSSEIFRLTPEKDGSGEVPSSYTGDVVVSHVSFSYEASQENVLNNISFHVQPGEFVAIVGPSGCGKSTLMRLLLGFEKINAGQIFHDGVPINRLCLPQLRRHVGTVLQDGALISGSILRNVQIATPDATVSEVKEVLRRVGLWEDVSAMPMGIYTHINEESQNLSGGQKQRILIARAVIGSPALLLLDEATSSLDNETQALVMKGLEEIKATRIVVAHRLTTVRGCDRILVMNKGRIVEEGSYDDLIKQKGQFYEMVKIQNALST